MLTSEQREAIAIDWGRQNREPIALSIQELPAFALACDEQLEGLLETARAAVKALYPDLSDMQVNTMLMAIASIRIREFN